MSFPKIWYMRPAKAQISLRIRAEGRILTVSKFHEKLHLTVACLKWLENEYFYPIRKVYIYIYFTELAKFLLYTDFLA